MLENSRTDGITGMSILLLTYLVKKKKQLSMVCLIALSTRLYMISLGLFRKRLKG